MEEEKGKKKKEAQAERLAYESPAVEVIEVESEGVIASSYPGGHGNDIPLN